MLGEDFEGYGAVQAGVGGLIHFAQAATAYWGSDFIGAEMCTGFDGHG